MSDQALVRRAVHLDGEFEQLRQVVDAMSDHGRKRAYADWLTERGDPRGAFLRAVLDDWDAGRAALTADESVDRVWRDACGVTLLQTLREGGLESQAAAICSAARPALKLTPVPAEGEVPLGATKFGGQASAGGGDALGEVGPEDRLLPPALPAAAEPAVGPGLGDAGEDFPAPERAACEEGSLLGHQLGRGWVRRSRNSSSVICQRISSAWVSAS